MYLNYQGITRLAHTHTFGYDEEERNHFLFNSPETKQGLLFACQLITTEFTKLLQQQPVQLSVDGLYKVDQKLLDYFSKTTQGKV